MPGPVEHGSGIQDALEARHEIFRKEDSAIVWLVPDGMVRERIEYPEL